MKASATTPAQDSSQPTVLSIAFPFAVVGPSAVGGAEVVLSQIEAALPSLGFRSLVVAREGSEPAGRLYATSVRAGEIDDALRTEVEAAQQANLDRALAENPVALVHLHGLDFDRYRLPPGMPVVVTLHLPPGWYPDTIWDLPPNYHLVCVSETQRLACPAHARERLQVIGNGVPLPDRGSLRPGGRYALILSRICPEKNLHAGFDAARAAGLPALLAGEVFPYREHLNYFKQQIEPRLTVPGTEHVSRNHPAHAIPDARFLGPVTGEPKARLLSRAACLLLPSLAPETSSLVAMEALAAGVPVIAVASGAVPEIVEHGRTGLLVAPHGDVAAGLAAALAQLPSLSRELCREAAETRFSIEHTLRAYAALYRKLISTTPANKPLPPAVQTTPNPDDIPLGSTNIAAVTGMPALDALRQEWTDLWLADPSATPFQHPAWLLPWARQFGPDGLVHAVVQRDAHESLIGILPLFTYAEPSADGRNGTRKLLLLGTGTTDYLGGVFRPGLQNVLPVQTLRFALGNTPAWDRLDFLQLRSDSPLLAVAEAFPAVQSGVAEPCAVLDLHKPLPAKLSVNIRRYQRLASAHGGLTCRVAASDEEAAQSFDDLIRLHRGRWESRHEPSVLQDERVQNHHREALPALLKAGLLRFFRLESKEQRPVDPAASPEPWAVLYALADPPQRPARRLYLYLIGIDIRYRDVSPGTLILHEVWDYARREGFASLDLLRGGETYKRLWGAEPESTHSLHSTAEPPATESD